MAKTYVTPYGPVAGIYDAFMALTGFKRGVENFLDRVEFGLPPRARILDAGTGTGLLALYLAKRYPDAEIIASDIDPEMLAELRRIAEEQGVGHRRLVIGTSDLHAPAEIRPINRQPPFTIAPNSLDAVFVSGALEHVPLDAAVASLARLIAPGGAFLNIGLKRNPAGTMLAFMYHCRPYRIADMRKACEAAGLTDIHTLRLGAVDFPANLSRVAIMARRPV